MSQPLASATASMERGEKAPLPSYTNPNPTHVRPKRPPIMNLLIFTLFLLLVYGLVRLPTNPQGLELDVPSFDDIADSLIFWMQREPASGGSTRGTRAADEAAGGRCPQQDPWKSAEDGIEVTFPDTQVLAERLSGGVQIDTSVGDDEASPQDDPESWNARFSPFRDYLRTTYPAIHADGGPVKLELVNEHALLYTFQGSDDSLKPLLLMAHQDVVPVDPQTVDKWTHPPFSGAIVNGTVWGRGSTDAKAWLFSILSSVEALIDSGFKPRRTVLISLGFDEEAQGRYGAKCLADRISERYGNDSLAMIVDEGNPVVPATEPNSFGFPIALPAVEEKGNIHMRVRIEGRGGHSSSPPDRTTIGLLSEFVSSLETGKDLRKPVGPSLESAHLLMLHCARLPPVVDKALRDLDAAARSSFEDLRAVSTAPYFSIKYLVLRLLQFNGALSPSSKQRRIAKAEQALLAVLPSDLKLPWSTTQTPTVFHGGIKLNAIPTSAQVEIDHRIALHQTPEEVMQWYKTHLARFAQKHGLILHAFGRQVVSQELWTGRKKEAANPVVGNVYVDVVSSSAPVPRTPLSGPEAAPWRLFSSVIRSVWSVPAGSYTPRSKEDTSATASSPSQSSPAAPAGESSVPILVSPSQMRGNTDTRHMVSPLHPLSRHVFRFGPASALPDPLGRSQFAGVHNVDEFFRVEGLERAVRFYAQVIRAVDQTGDF